MLEMPVLETARLVIRPFVLDDLPAAHRLLDKDLDAAALHADRLAGLAERAEWLAWAARNPVQLARLNQPPYGDRAAILKATGELVGACGYVPCLAPFEQLAGFGGPDAGESPGRFSPEFGLFYAISSAHQRRGYASEAARALVDFAFRHLNLKRIVAATDHDNIASIGVMRKLGMRIEKNPRPEPPWFQVVGVVENNA